MRDHRGGLYPRSRASRVRESSLGIFVVLGVVAVLVGVGFLIYYGVRADERFRQHCYSVGGHVKVAHSTGIGYDSKGRPVTTYSSTTYCLSTDGRILDTE